MWRTLVLSLAVVTLAQTPTHAQGAKLKPEAQVHLDAALAAYNAKDYPTAIREFDQAYAIDPNPALLYATAQAQRFAGNCRVALKLYEQYLETRPNETQVQATKVGIAECQAAAPPPDPITPPPTPPASAPQLPVASDPARADPPSQRDADPRPWYKDRLGGALTITGVAGIGVGVGFLVMASSSQRRAETAEFRDEFTAALDEATSRRRIGAIALTAGSALTLGGILIYVLRDRGARPVLTGGSDGRSLYVAGSF